MRRPSDVLREKVQQYKQLLKEIEALRVVIPILEDEPQKRENSDES